MLKPKDDYIMELDFKLISREFICKWQPDLLKNLTEKGSSFFLINEARTSDYWILYDHENLGKASSKLVSEALNTRNAVNKIWSYVLELRKVGRNIIARQILPNGVICCSEHEPFFDEELVELIRKADRVAWCDAAYDALNGD